MSRVVHYEPLAESPESHITYLATTTTFPSNVTCKLCLRIMQKKL
jgi:hypothetical protein